MPHLLTDAMDEEACYRWGELFASPWPELVEGMRARSAEMGLEQEAGENWINWTRGGTIRARFTFVDDPSDIEAIRNVYNDPANTAVPTCFVSCGSPIPASPGGRWCSTSSG